MTKTMLSASTPGSGCKSIKYSWVIRSLSTYLIHDASCSEFETSAVSAAITEQKTVISFRYPLIMIETCQEPSISMFHYESDGRYTFSLSFEAILQCLDHTTPKEKLLKEIWLYFIFCF